MTSSRTAPRTAPLFGRLAGGALLACLCSGALAFGQDVPNPDLDFTGVPPDAVPNGLTPDGWAPIGTPDVAWSALEVDCARVLEPSPNGGTWARLTTDEGIRADVVDLDPGGAYFVTFEQALLVHWGRSAGHLDVTLGDTTLAAPPVLPKTKDDPGQTPWTTQVLGPFLVDRTSAALSFVARSEGDGVDPTGGEELPGCDYVRVPEATDLLVDGVVVERDPPPRVPTVDAVVSETGQPMLTGSLDESDLAQFDVALGVFPAWTLGEHPELTTADGTWALDLGGVEPPLAPGRYEITATQTDPVGQVVVDATRLELLVRTGSDTGIPPVPSDQPTAETGEETGDTGEPEPLPPPSCGCQPGAPASSPWLLFAWLGAWVRGVRRRRAGQ